MDIIFYHPTFDTPYWINALTAALPGARVREWKRGDNEHADYALVWHPPVEMLQGRDLKAVFALGAGVDSILSKLKAHPEMLPEHIPLFRLEDTGMGQQMQEYAVSQVLHWFRRFDDYQALKLKSQWEPLPDYQREDFTVGILGAGVLGSKVAEALAPWGFPLRCWSRSRKTYPGVQSFAGVEELPAFLKGTRVPFKNAGSSSTPAKLCTPGYVLRLRLQQRSGNPHGASASATFEPRTPAPKIPTVKSSR